MQRILEMVREGTRAGALPNCHHFIRELEVSRRTLMRDLDFLRDDHHARIAYEDSRKGISHADQPWKVRLLFAPEVATYIRERMWHPSQTLRQHRDGTLDFRLQTSSRKELTRWILSWMPHIKVLAPRQLRDRVRQRMRQGLARCG